jgi:adenylate cyclase
LTHSKPVHQPLSRRQLSLGYLVTLLLAALFVLLPGGQQWEARWRDLGFRWLAEHAPLEAAPGPVIVGLDDNDLKGFGVPAAMLHRELGAFLEAMASAKPIAVGLDVLLPATSFDKLQPGLDASLARGIVAARSATSLVLGISTDAAGRPRPLHPLFAGLAGPDRLGYVFVLPDVDGVVRRFDERLGSAGESVPTLAGQMGRAIGLKPVPGIINYAQGRPFQYLPLRQVLAWREAGQTEALQKAFGGKVVLLGSVLAFDDQHRGPVPLAAWSDGATTSHGVLFHAQQLRNILAGNLIQPLHQGVQWLVLLLLASSWWWRPGPMGWGVASGLTLAVLAGSVYLLRIGLAVPALAWSMALLAGVVLRGGCAGWVAARERRRLRDTFGGFVSPPVLEEILSGRLDPKVGGARRDVCVLFSDIRGFTTLSESMPPEQVTSLLNRYFDHMTAAIHQHGGALDKFIGDGIMAVFGVPKQLPAPCADALAAAKSMVHALQRFNEEQARLGEPSIKVGVGLHFGPAIVGYVGSRDRFEYSAIGDTVNAASRIEGMTKELGCPVLLSAAVFDRLTDRSGITAMGSVAIRGRSSMDVFGWKPEVEEVP